MKTTDDGNSVNLPPPRKRYDSAASRVALLEAAARLFHGRGYDATTVREIGERAGVDPALIARYRVSEIVASQTVRPLSGAIEARDVPDARLRAEVALAVALGVSLTRAATRLLALREAAPSDFLQILGPVLNVLCGGNDAGSGK